MRQFFYAMIAVLAPAAATACAVTHFPTPESAARHDYALAGQVIEYRPEAWDSFPREHPRYALVKVKVTEVWKGDVGEVFEFVLSSNAYPVPTEWIWDDETIFVANDPKDPNALSRSSLPQVVNEICSTSYTRLTDENRVAFRKHFSQAQ